MSILDRLKSLLLRQYGIDATAIQTGAPLASLGLDSLDMVDFFYALEKEFNIKFPTENLNLSSVQDLLNLVEQAIKQQQPQEQLPRTAP